MLAVAGISIDIGNEGYFVPATVTGHLYIDANGNGTQDPGEPNLPDVDVIITDSAGNKQTVTTDANGNWTASVPPGTVTIDVDQSDPQYPSGSTITDGQDPTTVTVTAGTETDAGDVGLNPPTASSPIPTRLAATGNGPIPFQLAVTLLGLGSLLVLISRRRREPDNPVI